MQVIILAAGRGRRMGSLTNNCPKPMLPIHGRPKLVYTLETLPPAITEVIIIVGYLKEKIINYFGHQYRGKKIKYLVQEELNGSGGAVLLAKEEVRDRALVLMGDDLYQPTDLERLLALSTPGLLAYQTNQAEQFGLVTTDQENYLTAVVERPHQHRTGLVNTGAYLLTKEYFQFPPVAISTEEYGLPQTLVSLYPQIKTEVLTTDWWLPIGSPENLKTAEKILPKSITK